MGSPVAFFKKAGKERTDMEEKAPIGDKKSNDELHPKTVGRSAVLLGGAVLLFCALLLRIFLLQIRLLYDMSSF